MKVKIGLTIEPELLQEVDRLRGLANRSPFIEHLIRLGLKTYKKRIPVAPQVTSSDKGEG
jgi:metal-responsive CopG/Arc/MetJ family transcriptional regulator